MPRYTLPDNCRLLAICPIGIGNFLLLIPALQHLKTVRPDISISLLSLKKGIAEIANRYPCFSEIITVDAGKKQPLSAKIDFVKSLRKRFDVSIAFFPANRLEYNLLPFLAGVPVRAAYRYYNLSIRTLSFLNAIKVAISEVDHDLLQNFRALTVFDITLPGQFQMLPFPLSESELEYGIRFLTDHGLKNRTLFGIHPGSSAEHGMDKKRWPTAEFAALAQRIRKGRDAFFLIFGGPEESGIKSELAQAIGPGALAVETRSLFETASIISRCSRFLSNDSGVMHVAAACGVKTCGIFGPTSDIRTAPFGPEHRVVRAALDCAPCWTIRNVGRREECQYRDFRCLQKLRADEVFEKIKDWI